MDAILGFPLYYGIVAGFGTPMGNMSHFIDISRQVLSNFPVGNPHLRWRDRLTVSSTRNT